MNYKKRIITILSFIITVCTILLQAIYFLYLKPKGFEYVWDTLPYLLNIFIFLFGGLGFYLLKNNQKTHKIICILSGFAIVFNLTLMISIGMNRHCIVSFGSMEHPIVIKVDKKSDKAMIYQKNYFLFASNPQTLNTPLKNHHITWLNKDVATITYGTKLDPHAYVIANDTRKSNSYSHPAATLQGSWSSGKKKMEINHSKYTIDNHTYELKNITEVGVNAVIVNNAANQAEYVIGFEPSLSFTNDGYIKKGSKVSVLNLKTNKLTTYKKTSTDFSYQASPQSPDDKGKKTYQEMIQIIKDYPNLADYTNEYYYVKVLNTTTDKSIIALEAIKAFNAQGSADCQTEITIHQVTQTYGTDDDFYIEVATTQTTTCGVESETLDITWYYRVMKTKDGYLVTHTLHFDNGFYGLKALKEPVVYPCDGEEFHFIY